MGMGVEVGEGGIGVGMGSRRAKRLQARMKRSKRLLISDFKKRFVLIKLSIANKRLTLFQPLLFPGLCDDILQMNILRLQRK
jgi:hypothetical protein